MEKRSQAQLEKQMHELELNPKSDSEQIYEMEDWIVQMGQRKALLIPATGRWLWYDRLHNEWVPANCGIDEAILVTLGKVAGIKKLPLSGDVSEWCVYMQEDKLFGPLPLEELVNKVKSCQLPLNILVWSTKATTWLNVTLAGDAVGFCDDSGNTVSLIDQTDSTLPPPSILTGANIAQPPPPISGFPPVPPPISPMLAGSMQIPNPEPVGAQASVDSTVAQSRLTHFEIVVLDGLLKNQHFLLGDQFRVGREPDNDLALPDQKTSRHHLIIQRQDTLYQITDLNSSNGTFVNGKPISITTPLKSGDMIQIGDTKLAIVNLP